MRFIALFGAAYAANAIEQPPLGPKFLEESCARDVNLLCPYPTDGIHVDSKAFTFESPPDPILDLMVNPSAPPPHLVDVSFMIDTMINQALSFASEDPAPVIRVFHLKTGPSEAEDIKPPEKILDSMVQTLVDKTNEEPTDVVEKIVQHGNDLLKMNHDADFVRMARRLTQAETDEAKGRRPHLPFGCRKNRCLMNAFEQGVVSHACAHAIRVAEKTQSYMIAKEAKVEQDAQVFVAVSLVYLVLVIITAFLLRKRFKRIGNRMRAKSQTIRLIVQTVYSNPEIKSKIEKIVGKKFGAVPPLPAHLMKKNVGIGRPAYCFALKMMKLTALAFILTLIFVEPVHAMYALCILMMVRFIQLAFCAEQPSDDECTCCCCALSTKQVELGIITKEQSCCTCCKGTGVCSTGCAACCTGSGTCDCCSDGCDCCDPPAPECTCCCCGATDLDAKNGTLTEDQECCTCCKGTGKCSTGCEACCGDDPCDCCHDGCDCCDPPTPECECCCCGATDLDAKNGTLTADQECCTCCKGTGKCAEGCAACCGDDPCDCCHDGCDCCDPPAPTPECECCCCGATDLDAKLGTLTADQECCTCCKGTGKCAEGCAACCGDDPCDCCHDGCDCCDTPVPPPAPECECCCCGATDLDAKLGTLTADQECCTCCKGTGKCAEGCAACCENGDDSCDCCYDDCGCCDEETKPLVKRANQAIYEGIPIQIV